MITIKAHYNKYLKAEMFETSITVKISNRQDLMTCMFFLIVFEIKKSVLSKQNICFVTMINIL